MHWDLERVLTKREATSCMIIKFSLALTDLKVCMCTVAVLNLRVLADFVIV